MATFWIFDLYFQDLYHNLCLHSFGFGNPRNLYSIQSIICIKRNYCGMRYSKQYVSKMLLNNLFWILIRHVYLSPNRNKYFFHVYTEINNTWYLNSINVTRCWLNVNYQVMNICMDNRLIYTLKNQLHSSTTTQVVKKLYNHSLNFWPPASMLA